MCRNTYSTFTARRNLGDHLRPTTRKLFIPPLSTTAHRRRPYRCRYTAIDLTTSSNLDSLLILPPLHHSPAPCAPVAPHLQQLRFVRRLFPPQIRAVIPLLHLPAARVIGRPTGLPIPLGQTVHRTQRQISYRSSASLFHLWRKMIVDL